MKWRLLEVPEDNHEAARAAMRLNALGSLYFFQKSVLKRHRLGRLHRQVCREIETEDLKLVIEMPRDHLKTTMAVEGSPIWWSLPFGEIEEAQMRELGYDDEWIRWMKHSHDPSTRTAIVTETEPNSHVMGHRIDWHYESNDVFRWLFPEILPNAQCTWNEGSKHHLANSKGHGEGTYDFFGVGSAGQSRHYDRMVADDLVGRDAASSEAVMATTIEYFQLMPGLFDSEKYGPDKTGDLLVIGNRWSPFDLNGWIRDHKQNFRIISHSAEGGCCAEHPPGEPIFPEEFSMKKLADIREQMGPYIYSHQYLNLPVLEEQCVFQRDWLRFFTFEKAADTTGRLVFRHEVRDGETEKDVYPSGLNWSMIVDPNHAGEQGRARHSIIVVAFDPDTDRFYLVDVWAKSLSYDDLLANVYRMASKWKLNDFWLETVAAQRYLKYHIEYRNRVEGRQLRVRELRIDRTKNAKKNRIEALEPIVSAGKWWARRELSQFLEEYYSYPASRTLDVLDCCGYAPQTFDSVRFRDILSAVQGRNERIKAAMSRKGF